MECFTQLHWKRVYRPLKGESIYHGDGSLFIIIIISIKSKVSTKVTILKFLHTMNEIKLYNCHEILTKQHRYY